MKGAVIVGIDAGTSVIKAVAFDAQGRQLAVAATPNRYTTRAEDGAAFQPLDPTWDDCALTLRKLGGALPDLPARIAALAVTAQGDGCWLVGAGNRPVGDGWLWLDARAAPTVARLRAGPADAARFAATGTGLTVCQMGTQLAHMQATTPEVLDTAEVALHPKDWLYLKLTGVRATCPAEACFTFGDFRTGAYDEGVVAALGLSGRRHLLPPILDGSRHTHPLTAEAAAQTGLPAGLPVSLAHLDVVCTALGGGLVTDAPGALSVIGSTGVHMRALAPQDVPLNPARTGFVMRLPVDGLVAMMHSNMAATLNIDWLLALAGDLAADLGAPADRAALIARIDGWMARAEPGAGPLYHPYISEAGERGPFVDANARAGFVGLSSRHRWPDLVRAVIEGLGLAARDCFADMGPLPKAFRITGGAARSRALRSVLSAAVGAPAQVALREEAGAVGAAMHAAVAIGAFPDMRAAIAAWVTPTIGAPEAPDPVLAARLARRYPPYRAARDALPPVWAAMAATRGAD